MNFLKNLKDKIKVIFRGKEKEQETEVKEEEQITELIQAEVPEEEADKEQEVIQENTELADNGDLKPQRGLLVLLLFF